jgi:hypothetical protein
MFACHASGIRLRVWAEVIDTDPLASVEGTSHLLLLDTDLNGHDRDHWN